MKRAALTELRRVASLPTYAEVVRKQAGKLPIVFYASVVEGPGGALDIGVALGYSERDDAPPRPNDTVPAVALTSGELRRLAEIREAIDRWNTGDGDWPTPRKAGPS